MDYFNQICITTQLSYRSHKQSISDKFDDDSERGAVSLEVAIVGGALLLIAIAIAAKLSGLGSQAEEKIPESL